MSRVGIIGTKGSGSCEPYCDLIKRTVFWSTGRNASVAIIDLYGHPSSCDVLCADVGDAKIVGVDVAGYYEFEDASLRRSVLCNMARSLVMCGCDYITFSDPVMYRDAKVVKRAVDTYRDGSGEYPYFVHPGDIVSEKLKEKNIRRILLLGSKHVMEERCMTGFFSDRHGIQVMGLLDYPDVIDGINRAIISTIQDGIVTSTLQKSIVSFLGGFSSHGMEPDAIVLFSVGLDGFINPSKIRKPIFDMTLLHVDKLAEIVTLSS